MNLAIAQVLLKVGMGGLASLVTILGEIGPVLITLGPDVTQLIADLNKLLSDIQGKGSAILTALETAAKTGTPQS